MMLSLSYMTVQYINHTKAHKLHISHCLAVKMFKLLNDLQLFSCRSILSDIHIGEQE